MFDVFGYSTDPEVSKRQLEEDYLEDFFEEIETKKEADKRIEKEIKKKAGEPSWANIYAMIQRKNEEIEMLKEEIREYTDICMTLHEENSILEHDLEEVTKEKDEYISFIVEQKLKEKGII